MSTKAATLYPEHEKMAKVRVESQAIGRFIDEGGYTLCVVRRGEYVPTHKTIEKLLAEHFDINLDRIEAEKRQMLDVMRKANP